MALQRPNLDAARRSSDAPLKGAGLFDIATANTCGIKCVCVCVCVCGGLGGGGTMIGHLRRKLFPRLVTFRH